MGARRPAPSPPHKGEGSANRIAECARSHYRNASWPVAPTFADILAARARIASEAVRTPLLYSPFLSERLSARVYLKPECLQRTGSFKFRGAYNALSVLDPALRKKGVVAVSSGNHAQGVAEAARLFGVPATIVMPADAPAPKRRRTERSGARVVAYDRATEDRDAVDRPRPGRSGRRVRSSLQ